MLNRCILIVFLLLGFVNLVSATGPSYIQSEIRPISINNKGEVLCRTRFVQNPSGAHWYMPATYGLCVLTKDSIVSIASYDYNPNDYDNDNDLCTAKQNYLDSIFYNSCLELIDFSKAVKIRIKKQGFISCNVDRYKVEKDYTIAGLKKYLHIDLAKNPQKALNGAKSIIDPDIKQSVRVVYNFGNILLLKNDYNGDEEETGLSFDYPCWFGKNDIGFDMSYITGVVFR